MRAIDFTPAAQKQLSKIDRQAANRIIQFLEERVAQNPTVVGSPLKGQLKEFWRWRIGDYRVLAKIQNDRLLILVVHVGHRRDVYKLKPS